MARKYAKLISLSTDDKVKLLAKLQGSPHFEKTLTASTAAGVCGNKTGLTLPAWFVQKHGEKFRRSVLLQTESSAQSSWPVTLTVHCFSPTGIQVKFCGGWKAFTTSNGLVEGDSLIFALTSMSEFQVHIFRSMPKEGTPSHAQIRGLTYESERSGKKPKQSFIFRDVQQLVADEENSSEGEVEVKRLEHVSQLVNSTVQKGHQGFSASGLREEIDSQQRLSS